MPVVRSNSCKESRVGILFGESAGGLAVGNVCTGNGSGIVVGWRGTSPTLRDNVCRENHVVGLAFIDGASGLAAENACIGNAEDGIRVHGRGTVPTLRTNACIANASSGISYLEGAGGMAENNNIEDNGCWGIYRDENSHPILHHNVVSAHARGEIH